MELRATNDVAGKLDRIINDIQAVRDSLPVGCPAYCELTVVIPELRETRRNLGCCHTTSDRRDGGIRRP